MIELPTEIEELSKFFCLKERSAQNITTTMQIAIEQEGTSPETLLK